MRRAWIVDLVLWLFISVPLLLLKADWPWAGSWWAVVLGGVVLALCTAIARRRPLLSLAIVLMLSLAVPPHFFTPAFSLALASFGYLTGRRMEQARPALAVFAATAALGAVAAPLLGSPVWLWSWFTLLLTVIGVVVLPWLVGRCVRQYAGLVSTGWELADRMEREQKAVSEQARLRERSRIAGDMHDSLGHELSLIAVRAAALEVDPGLGQQQQGAARELREAAGMATARLREIIGVLREEGSAQTTPVNETVAEAVERARGSGMAVTLREAGEGPKVPEMTDRAIHRVVQEALTNAAKHAPGAAVGVSVIREEDAVTTTVSNAHPTASSPGLASGGAGLMGLDERVRLAGGTLSHGPLVDGGFMVVARMPVTRLSAAPVPAPTPSISQRELEHARRRLRRGLRQAVVAPVAAGAVLASLMFGLWIYTETNSVLGNAAYHAMRLGDSATELQRGLPPVRYEVGPNDQKKPGCVYYRIRRFAPMSAYELCFADDQLASKAIVN